MSAFLQIRGVFDSVTMEVEEKKEDNPEAARRYIILQVTDEVFDQVGAERLATGSTLWSGLQSEYGTTTLAQGRYLRRDFHNLSVANVSRGDPAKFVGAIKRIAKEIAVVEKVEAGDLSDGMNLFVLLEGLDGDFDPVVGYIEASDSDFATASKLVLAHGEKLESHPAAERTFSAVSRRHHRQDARGRACFYFQRGEQCPYGKKCRFVHEVKKKKRAASSSDEEVGDETLGCASVYSDASDEWIN